MESGFRVNDTGEPIQRNIITALEVKMAGEVVFSAALGSGIAANPSLGFSVVAQKSGKLEVTWSGDNNCSGYIAADIAVEG
ncbi:MAG: thiosulfate oxidation carrier complex protein SoxZ [Candidatus Protistobacter heckmanni]|nr:thiosulfate oxidation carrier complex protein SoxZ [Candidatus Protistobacter heckmanni]